MAAICDEWCSWNAGPLCPNLKPIGGSWRFCEVEREPRERASLRLARSYCNVAKVRLEQVEGWVFRWDTKRMVKPANGAMRVAPSLRLFNHSSGGVSVVVEWRGNPHSVLEGVPLSANGHDQFRNLEDNGRRGRDSYGSLVCTRYFRSDCRIASCTPSSNSKRGVQLCLKMQTRVSSEVFITSSP